MSLPAERLAKEADESINTGKGPFELFCLGRRLEEEFVEGDKEALLKVGRR